MKFRCLISGEAIACFRIDLSFGKGVRAAYMIGFVMSPQMNLETLGAGNVFRRNVFMQMPFWSRVLTSTPNEWPIHLNLEKWGGMPSMLGLGMQDQSELCKILTTIRLASICRATRSVSESWRFKHVTCTI